MIRRTSTYGPSPRIAAFPRLSAHGAGWALAMAAVLITGGGNWTMPLPRLLAEAIAVGMLVAALAAPHWPQGLRMTSADWLWAALLGLIAAHLVPLPPAVWTALPGRASATLADRALFGAPLWRPLSLDPEATWRTPPMLLPAFATYLAVRLGDDARRRALLAGVAGAALAAIALAMLQLALPHSDWLRPYPRGDYGLPIGFFTNRNHQATFLLCSLPLAGAWLALRGEAPRAAQPWLLTGFAVLVAAGVLVTVSRSGAALLPLAFAGTLLAVTGVRNRRQATLLLLALLVALIAAGVFVLAVGGDGLTGVLRRDGPFDDPRLRFWPAVAGAAMRFWPLGSGIGTFLDGYEMHEPLEVLGGLYLNHAHNDFLEILLEAGVPGMVLALSGIWELLLLGAGAWRAGDRAGRLAAVSLALPVLHSLVDYPLRTIAISSLAALGAALLAAPRDRAPAHT